MNDPGSRGVDDAMQEVPEEHLRFARYPHELADVCPEDEAGLVEMVLCGCSLIAEERAGLVRPPTADWLN